MLPRSQNKMVKTLSLLSEIPKSKDKETNEQPDEQLYEQPDEQPDTTDMSELESEESAAQRKKQAAAGLKILTPSKMLNRLPISLAQLKAGNNSEKLENEIRQLLYSLYRSKNLIQSIIT